MKRLVPVIALLLIAASLTACGRRGPLEPPPGSVSMLLAPGAVELGKVISDRSLLPA